MCAKPELDVEAFPTVEALERWLEAHHDRSPGIWLKFAKKGSGIESVTYPEAVEVALCYGWIDGQRSPLDDKWFLQRFTPRQSRSKWSKINRDKAIALIESGRMRPAGLREVERAKADGRWDAAYDPSSTIGVPEDLERAFAENPAARAFFETLDRTNRYAVLYRIADAKKAETRARRIDQFVAMLAEGRKLHP